MSRGIERIPQDVHHVFWERRDYRTPLEKRVRRLGAFMIEGPKDWHRELHANVTPPPKLDHDAYYDLYNFMRDRSYEIGTLEGLEWGMTWAVSRKRYELFENLDHQFHYLAGNHVEVEAWQL